MKKYDKKWKPEENKTQRDAIAALSHHKKWGKAISVVG